MLPFLGGYSHYFLISGQDFPIKSIDEIVDFLRIHEDDNFIECSTVTKFEKRNEIYFPSCVIGRKLWQKVIKNLWIYGTGGWNRTFSIFKRKPVDGFSYYFGSQWWCLNDKTARWIYNYLDRQPKYIKLFSHSLCPDECFFQTLVMNSPYADNVKPYLHYIKWENGMSSPKTLTTIDYEELKKTEKIIARKFDMDVDSEIIERLRKR